MTLRVGPFRDKGRRWVVKAELCPTINKKMNIHPCPSLTLHPKGTFAPRLITFMRSDHSYCEGDVWYQFSNYAQKKVSFTAHLFSRLCK